MKRTFAAAAAMTAALLAVASSPAGAAVTGTTGQVVSVPPPSSVADGAYTSNTQIRVFAEKQVTLAASLTIAEVWTPTGKQSQTWNVGACFQSHLVHYDRASGDGRVSGSVTFGQPVIAVLPFVVGLTATDALMGLPATTYPGIDPLRGFEPASALVAAAEADSIVATNAVTLDFNLFERSTVGIPPLTSDSRMDQIRVLTGCDPEPVIPEAGQVILLSLGTLGLLGAAVAYNRRRGALAA